MPVADHTAVQHQQTPARPTAARLFLLVFVPFATSYFLSYLFRSVNAVIAPDLMRDIGLGASGLGILTAAFFLGFSFVQLPLGLMLDRYGAARVQSALLLVAALGSLIFALADSAAGLAIGRLLIGLGCAGGLMAAFKAILKWYPPQWLGLVNGLYLATGGMGAMAATQPAEWVVGATGWRGLFLLLAAGAVASSLLIFLLVPRGDGADRPAPFGDQVREIGRILRDRLFWRYVPVTVFGMGGSASVQGLWAGPWLADVAGLNREEIAARLLAMTTAITVGFVLTGFVADRLRRAGVSSLAVIAAGTGIAAAALAAIVAGLSPQGWWHWILMGLTANASAQVYPVLARHFGAERAGRANTANTLLVFVGTFLIQYAMGAIIDLWPRDAAGQYPVEAYRAAFLFLLAGMAASLAWLIRPGADRVEAARRGV